MEVIVSRGCGLDVHQATVVACLLVGEKERTLEGVEALHMMRKGRVKRLAGDDAMGQANFVLSLFQIAA